MRKLGKNSNVHWIRFGVGFPPWTSIWICIGILTVASTVKCQLEIIHDQHPHASVVKYTDVLKSGESLYRNESPMRSEYLMKNEYPRRDRVEAPWDLGKVSGTIFASSNTPEHFTWTEYSPLDKEKELERDYLYKIKSQNPAPSAGYDNLPALDAVEKKPLPVLDPEPSPRLRYKSESHIEFTPSVTLPYNPDSNPDPSPKYSSSLRAPLHSDPSSSSMNSIYDEASAPYSANKIQINSYSHAHTRPQPPFLKYREDVRKQLNQKQVEESEEMIQYIHHHHNLENSENLENPPTYRNYNSPPPPRSPPPPPPRPPPSSSSSSSFGRYHGSQGPMNMKQFRHISPPPIRSSPVPQQHHHHYYGNNQPERQRSFMTAPKPVPDQWGKYPRSRVDSVQHIPGIRAGPEPGPEPEPVMVSLDHLLTPPAIKINKNYQKIESTTPPQFEDEITVRSDPPNVAYSTIYQEQLQKRPRQHQNQNQNQYQYQRQIQHPFQRQRQQQPQQQQYYQDQPELPQDFDFSPSETEKISRNFQKSCASQFPEMELLRFLCQQRQRSSMKNHHHHMRRQRKLSYLPF